MITANDTFINVPARISRWKWLSILSGYGSDAGVWYDTLINLSVEPLFVLAIFRQESNYGTNPNSVNVRYHNHNPGNLRNPPPDAPVIQTDRGPFLTFLSWDEGFRALGEHLSSALYSNLSIGEAIDKWAPTSDGNDPIGYTASVLDFMNANTDTKGMDEMRFIIQAGHVNIGNITSDPNNEIDPSGLRNETGADGEADWNQAMATALVALLKNVGADAVFSDAIYHADIYGQDADMVYAVHYDGLSGTGHPQYCMASTVHAGASTAAVDSKADAFVVDWQNVYPSATNIPDDGPITDNMTQYYGGWYRTANTPMVIGEHCLGADSGGVRNDRPSPDEAAQAVFDVFDKHFNLTKKPAADVFYQPGRNIPIKTPFWNRFNLLESVKGGLGYAEMGFALEPETTDSAGNRVQKWERGIYKVNSQATDPWDVVAMLLAEYPQ